MSEKKNTLKRNVIVVGIIISIAISLIVFFQTQISSKISNHPKIVRMEMTQGHIQYQYDELKILLKDLNYKIEVLDRKMDKLLQEEYP